MRVQPVANDTRYTDESRESWTNWWLFRRLTDEEVADTIEYYEIKAIRGRAGQIFLCDPVVKHTEHFTEIRQFGGYDI